MARARDMVAPVAMLLRRLGQGYLTAAMLTERLRNMAKLQLSVAVGNYDRVRPLMDGAVQMAWGQLKAALSGLVSALLAKPPEALRQTQALLRREDTEEILTRMEQENGQFAERLQSDEVKQAIAAFFAARTRAPAA